MWGKPQVTSGFPLQMASNKGSLSILQCHHYCSFSSSNGYANIMIKQLPFKANQHLEKSCCLKGKLIKELLLLSFKRKLPWSFIITKIMTCFGKSGNLRLVFNQTWAGNLVPKQFLVAKGDWACRIIKLFPSCHTQPSVDSKVLLEHFKSCPVY